MVLLVIEFIEGDEEEDTEEEEEEEEDIVGEA